MEHLYFVPGYGLYTLEQAAEELPYEVYEAEISPQFRELCAREAGRVCYCGERKSSQAKFCRDCSDNLY